jgi:hypothetical protein
MPPCAFVHFSEIIVGLEADLADARAAAGQGIDVGELDASWAAAGDAAPL